MHVENYGPDCCLRFKHTTRSGSGAPEGLVGDNSVPIHSETRNMTDLVLTKVELRVSALIASELLALSLDHVVEPE